MQVPQYTVQTGQACYICKQDYWIVRHGYNQCKCGQYLWIIRTGEPHLVSRTGKYEIATRFRYHQGNALPKGYPGWQEVTIHSAAKLSTEAIRPLLGV